MSVRRQRLYSKEICACSIFGAMNRDGERFTGKRVIRAMANMHHRGNGLGGGFAAYGIYPEFREYYAFHLMFTGDARARREAKRAAEGNRTARVGARGPRDKGRRGVSRNGWCAADPMHPHVR